jgi:HlyD family secretion protein
MARRRISDPVSHGAASHGEAAARREPTLRTPLMAGLATIVLGCGGFVGWAVSAQLDSASIAIATIVVDSRRKTVNHLEGGILSRLLVEEGHVVREGQPLLRLENTRARAEMDQLRARQVGLRVRLARLRTEQALETTLTLPSAAELGDSVVTPDVIAAEHRLFKARREMFERRIAIQRKTIEQQDAELTATRAQTDANTRQSELNERELKAIAHLVERGFARRPQLTELQTRESELIGRAGELMGRKAKAEQARAQAELEILGIETEFQQQVAADLQQAQLELAEVTERMAASADVLRRVEIVAPQDGVVVNIRTRTPGGVIAPGQPILDIVPEHEPLVVEARVGLRDIDAVRIGAPVQVRLTAYNHRTTAPLDGRLTYVAADQQVDERTGTAFYVTRAEILPASLAASPDIRLHPGMSAEVLILNRARKAADYLLAPLTESFARAFRED